MKSSELVCREFVELVTDYFEGALSEADQASFEDHLRACKGCQAYLDQMRITIESGRALSAEEIPSAAMDELLTAFRNWNSDREPS